METVIPDGLPSLASGSHGPSEGKACVMEYVALLAGESWTDLPECTHPLLSFAAQIANDTLGDEVRGTTLAPLIGRLFGANEGGPKVQAAFLAVLRPRINNAYTNAVAQEVIGANVSRDSHGVYSLREVVRGAVDPSWTPGFPEDGARWDRERSGRAVSLLTDLLDAYDKATGRTIHPIPAATLNRLTEQVMAGARA